MECILATTDFIACAKLLASNIADPQSRTLLLKGVTDIETKLEKCLSVAKTHSNDDASLRKLSAASKQVSKILASLKNVLTNPGGSNMNEIMEDIINSSNGILTGQDMIGEVKKLAKASSELIETLKKEADNQENEQYKKHLLKTADNIAFATSGMLDNAKLYAQDPNNEEKRNALAHSTDNLRVIAIEAADMVNRRKLITQLEKAAKIAAFASTKCISAANESKKSNDDKTSKTQLAKACSSVADVVPRMVEAIKLSIEDPISARTQINLIEKTEDFLEPAENLMKKSQSAYKNVENKEASHELKTTSSQLAKSLKELAAILEKNKVTAPRMNAAKELLDSLGGELDDFENALNKNQLKPEVGFTKEGANLKLNSASKNILSLIKKINEAKEKGNKDAVQNLSKELSSELDALISAVKEISASSGDTDETRKLIENAKHILATAMLLLEDLNNDGNSGESGAKLAEAIKKMNIDLKKARRQSDTDLLENIKAKQDAVKDATSTKDVAGLLNIGASMAKVLEKEIEDQENEKTKKILTQKLKELKDIEDILKNGGKLSAEEEKQLLEDYNLHIREAGDYIARLKLMDGLSVMADSSANIAEMCVTEAQNNIKKYNLHNDDLDNAVTSTKDNIALLKSSIQNFKADPGSALAQANLLKDTKEFTESSKRMIENSRRSLLDTIKDKNEKSSMMGRLDELENLLTNMSVQESKTNEFSGTLEIDAASELLSSLEAELDDFKAISKTIGLKPQDNETLDQSQTGMLNSARAIKSDMNSLMKAAVDNNNKGINSSSLNVANNMELFKDNVRSAVVNTSSPTEQEKLLNDTANAIEHAKELMKHAKKTAKMPTEIKDINSIAFETSNVSNSLFQAVLTLPNTNEEDIIKEIMNSINEELKDFKSAVQKLEPNKKTVDMSQENKKLEGDSHALQKSVKTLMENSESGDKDKINDASAHLVSSLQNFVGSSKMRILHADRKNGNQMLNESNEVVQKSEVLLSEAQNISENKGGALNKAGKDVIVAVDVCVDDFSTEKEENVATMMKLRDQMQTAVKNINSSKDTKNTLTNVRDLAKSGKELVDVLIRLSENAIDPSEKVK